MPGATSITVDSEEDIMYKQTNKQTNTLATSRGRSFLAVPINEL